jgi:hypothetical protein
MLAVTLTIGTLVSIIFFFIGVMLGWMIKQHVYETNVVAYTHPEMFDSKGNLIPDEILAVRFENDYEHDYDEDEEEDSETR